MTRGIRTRLWLAALAASLAATLSVGAVAAGEITGNGELLEVKGQSACAFSGQEDLQWFFDNFQEDPKPMVTRGDPGHAQSWGQAKDLWGFLISIGEHPGMACNPSGQR
jgi:hypothetical protein